MAITTTDVGLLRLLQLSSVSLPVGGYAFSQGLEYAVEAGWVDSVESAEAWLELQMHDALARVDLPILWRIHRLCQVQQDGGENTVAGVQYWNRMALACRETKELRLADTAMGEALQRLLTRLDVPLDGLRQAQSAQPCAPAQVPAEVSFVAVFACAAQQWQVNAEAALLGYAWSWLENQVAAATKLVPLGQTHAQQLLGQLQQCIPATIATAKSLADDELGASLPALAIASALHETQYTRLFRS
ncbi:urease accessory protein UreF [Aestuariicella hydrocarbonica]|uniref:Urease accessory protein UreF n=1 Tax=Pseudomaricurvus hydrocarbonicus TaxID=1470433 RepID=A0A9E5JXW0_9GAMM|nr:urease accessory UreF family protein [Aestuariicella hydrocarbonica]NHO66570.1 urease accessory protein UreF [Aestuariicella hydrocarbonica]